MGPVLIVSLPFASRLKSSRAGARGRGIALRAFVLYAALGLAGCGGFRGSMQAKSDEAQRLAQQARQAEDRGDPRSAEILLTAAVNKNPRDCETRLELSELLLQHGSLPVAVAHLRKLVAENPNDSRGYVRLAEALYHQQRYADAERALSQALELDPQQSQGLLLRGKIAELQGKEDEALEAYYRALLGDPDHVEAGMRVAAIYLRRGQPERAAPLLRSLLDSEAACPVQLSAAAWSLGVAYAQQGRWSEAVVLLERAAAQRNMTADDWYGVAYARRQVGDIPGARQAVGDALAVEPTHPAVLQLQRELQARSPELAGP